MNTLKVEMVKKIGYVATAAALLAALPIQAAVLSGSNSSAVKTSVSSAVNGSSNSSNSSGGVNASVGVSRNTNSNTGSTSSGNSGSVGVNVGATGNDNGSASGNADLSAGITVSRSDVTADQNANVVTSSNVYTAQNMSDYIATQIRADSNLSKVSVDSDNTAVSYRESAKFLGFIPSHSTVTVNVDSNGNVTFHYPWYHFLMSSDDASLKADVQAKAQGTLTANAGLEGSIATRAQVLNAIITALRADANGSADASAAASSNEMVNGQSHMDNMDNMSSSSMNGTMNATGNTNTNANANTSASSNANY